jgi:hypothetical protein
VPRSPLENVPLDGTVGGLAGCEEGPPFRPRAGFPVLVSVGGAAGADPRSDGLAEDIRLLVQAFVLDSESVRRSEACQKTVEDCDLPGDIEIALHGLPLEPDAKVELQQQIEGLVRQRFVASKGAKKKR